MIKIICDIRNKFAHSLSTELTFTDKTISGKIGRMQLRPKYLDDIDNPKFQFSIAISTIETTLLIFSKLIPIFGPKNFVEIYKWNEHPPEDLVLPKEELLNTLKKEMKKISND